MTLLIYLHIGFNRQPVVCLSHLNDRWSRQGVLRVELFLRSAPENYNLQKSYAKEFRFNSLSNYDDYQKNSSLSKQNQAVRK